MDSNPRILSDGVPIALDEVATVFKTAPKAPAFVAAWLEEIFKPAAVLAAGKDGRLSENEAQRAAAATQGPLSLSGEALQAMRAATGQVRPSLAKLRATAEALLTASAQEAAGPDGKLSYADARKLLPGAEKGYLALRGKLSSEPAAPGAATKLGVISDIDKTVLPEHGTNEPLPAPYPGVTVLYQQLELAKDQELDATWYVTARDPERVTEIPAWFAEHGLPSLGIDTGVGTAPWIAEPEKVKDCLKVLDANPDRKFILFGDTSHRDPEVYRKVRALRPEQVEAIVIHKVNATVAPSRVEGMYLITNYAEAAAELHHAGLLTKTAARKVFASARAEGLALTLAEGDALLAPRS